MDGREALRVPGIAIKDCVGWSKRWVDDTDFRIRLRA